VNKAIYYMSENLNSET